MRKVRYLIAMVLFGSAEAAVIRSATSASIITGNEFDACCDIGNVIDQSGLSLNYTSGVTDFDTYIGLNPLHTFYYQDNEYFANNGTLTGLIEFDLGGIFSLDRIALWNEEGAGISLLDILVSTDGLIFTEILSDFSPIDNPDADYPAEVISLGGAFDAQFVRIDMNSCLGLFCSMGEIAFSAEDIVVSPVPEPAVVWLLGAGLIGLIGKRKKPKLSALSA